MVGGGLCLCLEVSHLDLNILKEELLDGFSPYRGFALVVRLHVVYLALMIFIHIIW